VPGAGTITRFFLVLPSPRTLKQRRLDDVCHELLLSILA
jgi:hypothetical protein